MTNQNRPLRSNISSTAADDLTVNRYGTNVDLYSITEQDLDSLTDSKWALWATFATALFGAVIPLALDLFRGSPSDSPLELAVIAGVTVSLFILLLVFTIVAVLSFLEHRRKIRQFKRRARLVPIQEHDDSESRRRREENIARFRERSIRNQEERRSE